MTADTEQGAQNSGQSKTVTTQELRAITSSYAPFADLPDEAIESLKQALRLDPNAKSAYYALGGVESGRGNYEAAYASESNTMSR